MFRNYEIILKEAKRFLSPYSKGIVVFDIDDTLIDYQYRPIYPVVDFYNWIKWKGLTPVIITARIGTKENIVATLNILRENWITDFTYIFFRPENCPPSGVAQFKEISRKLVVENVGQIVASIGDSYWDVGKYGGYPIQLY